MNQDRHDAVLPPNSPEPIESLVTLLPTLPKTAESDAALPAESNNALSPNAPEAAKYKAALLPSFPRTAESDAALLPNALKTTEYNAAMHPNASSCRTPLPCRMPLSCWMPLPCGMPLPCRMPLKDKATMTAKKLKQRRLQNKKLDKTSADEAERTRQTNDRPSMDIDGRTLVYIYDTWGENWFGGSRQLTPRGF